MSAWPIAVGEGAINSPAIQPPYRPPGRVVVPTEEREARANRFASQVAGHTDNAKPSPSNSKVLQWLPVVRQQGRSQAVLDLLADLLEQEVACHPSTCSDQHPDQTNP